MLGKEEVEQGHRLGLELELERLPVLHLGGVDLERDAALDAPDVVRMPDVAEVLDAQAGEDQERGGERALDAPRAAGRARLAQRPRRLLFREGQELPHVLGVVELVEPVAVAPAHHARLVRVEPAAEQVDLLLRRRIDANIVPRHMAELLGDPVCHGGGRVRGTARRAAGSAAGLP